MDWIEGRSPAARTLEALLVQVASGDVPILLQGESGSGKTAAAREIHRRSPRAGEPCVEIQLGTLAPTLIESVGSSRVDLQACKLEYSIVSPK